MVEKRAIKRQSLPDVIADDLRGRILSGELAEGETIRQEALAEDYGVSRMPVREALKRLNAEGLIQWHTNRGGTVTKHSLEEIAEIFDLRCLIETDLFRRAIPRMNASHFSDCEAILKRMDASYDDNDIETWGVLNHQYHTALYAASERGLTNEILDRISVQSDRYVRMHLSVMKQRAPARTEHHELLELARAAQINEACDLLTRHILRSKDQLLEMIASKRSAER